MEEERFENDDSTVCKHYARNTSSSRVSLCTIDDTATLIAHCWPGNDGIFQCQNVIGNQYIWDFSRSTLSLGTMVMKLMILLLLVGHQKQKNCNQ